MKMSIPLSRLKEHEGAIVKYIEGKSLSLLVKKKTTLCGNLSCCQENSGHIKESTPEKNIDYSLRERMFSMGIIPGASIQRMGDCPLRDPVIININGHCISLRKGEADLVIVETNL